MVPAKPVVDCEVRRQQPGAAARRFRRDLRSDLLRQRVHSPAARDGARVAPRAEACAQAGRLAVDLDIERREPRAARAVAAGRLRLLLPPIRGHPWPAGFLPAFVPYPRIYRAGVAEGVRSGAL